MAAIAAIAFENLRHLAWLEGENRRLQENLNIERQLIGESTTMREVYQMIGRVAPSDSTVLILGESGPAKSWLPMLFIETAGEWKPFVVVNCAALAETLLESELFGNEKDFPFD